MSPLPYFMNTFWTGLFAGCLAILYTALPRYILPSFICGCVGRAVRDLLVTMGLSTNWSTVVAAVAVVLVAVAIIRRHVISPVVLISAVIPLGAAVPAFGTLFELIKVSSASGDALNTAAVALAANVGKLVIVSLAIAVGIAVGIAIVRVLSPKEATEV